MTDDQRDDETLNFFGLPVRVASMDECERTAKYIVCGRADEPSPFTDNKIGQCVVCGVPVIYRPYMPEKLAKLCIECFPSTVNPS